MRFMVTRCADWMILTTVLERRLLMMLLPLLIFGCGKEVELYRNLGEIEANQIIAELDSGKIKARKEHLKGGITFFVAEKEMSAAVQRLDRKGLPRPPRVNLGEIFRKEGVISTPLDARQRKRDPCYYRPSISESSESS